MAQKHVRIEAERRDTVDIDLLVAAFVALAEEQATNQPLSEPPDGGAS